jgi:pimeloyl-ACP methyl ester carboxylesterase
LARWRKTLLRSAAWAVGIYLVVVVAMFLLQRRLLYFPSHDKPQGSLTPWRTQDRLIGYCREVARPDTIWLMMHGNAGQAADRDYVLHLLADNDAFYVLEYPGYGSREGQPTQRGINAAAKEAFQVLRKAYPNTPICVLGESLGSGPACMLTCEPSPPEKVILAVPFDSLRNVVAHHFSFLPVQLLLLDQWDNVQALKGYAGKVEILAADNDEVIPPLHAEALARQVPNSQFIRIPGGHNEWSSTRSFAIRK